MFHHHYCKEKVRSVYMCILQVIENIYKGNYPHILIFDTFNQNKYSRKPFDNGHVRADSPLFYRKYLENSTHV